MSVNVGKEVAALKRMTVRELRVRYTEVFGKETRAGNKQWLIKRIAWRLLWLHPSALGCTSTKPSTHVVEMGPDAMVSFARIRSLGRGLFGH